MTCRDRLVFGNAVDFDITVFIGSLQAYLASYPRWTLYCVEQIYSLLCLPDIVEGMCGSMPLFLFQDTFVEIFKADGSILIQSQQREIYSEQM